MKATRKRYSAEFKAKVALEAIRGDLTLAELEAKHGVHRTMIASWLRQAIDGMASTSSGSAFQTEILERCIKFRRRWSETSRTNQPICLLYAYF